MQPETLVDLDRYPLDDPAARARIVTGAQAALAAGGSAALPGFVRPEAVAAMAAEAMAAEPAAHRRDRMLGAYPETAEDEFPPDHPRNRTSPYRMKVVATDEIDPAGPTLTLYEWPALTRLVAEILGLDRLHLVADPLMRCNFTILKDGDSHGWHFDGNDFVVSLLIQKPQAGGAFEYAPMIRSADDENYDAVARVLDGQGPTRLERQEPGTLILFRGRRTLHRVTPVEGPRPRIIALFSYDEREGLSFGPETHMRIFGRAA